MKRDECGLLSAPGYGLPDAHPGQVTQVGLATTSSPEMLVDVLVVGCSPLP